jgi:hypothetical protein
MFIIQATDLDTHFDGKIWSGNFDKKTASKNPPFEINFEPKKLEIFYHKIGRKGNNLNSSKGGL